MILVDKALSGTRNVIQMWFKTGPTRVCIHRQGAIPPEHQVSLQENKLLSTLQPPCLPGAARLCKRSFIGAKEPTAGPKRAYRWEGAAVRTPPSKDHPAKTRLLLKVGGVGEKRIGVGA